MIGLGQGKTFIASETSAFSRYTKNFIAMKDGEIGVVRSTDHTLDISRVEIAPESEVLLSPDPYPHFTLKECLEQPEAIARALNYGARLHEKRVVLGGLDNNLELMQTIQNLLITGCGTSKHAAEFGAKIMRDLDCFDTVSVLDAAEVRRSDIPKRAGGLIAVSQSGTFSLYLFLLFIFCYVFYFLWFYDCFICCFSSSVLYIMCSVWCCAVLCCHVILFIVNL